MDIAACSPDFMVLLGDYGSNETIGTIAGLEQVHNYIKPINAQLMPILGNHDLQLEDGHHNQLPGTMVEAFKRIFELDRTYYVKELAGLRLFFISTENQPPDAPYYLQECFVSDTQFSWIIDQLNKRPEVPCIFFTHAPPAGSKLKTVPEVHVRATNAYLDQNHNPYRWYELIKNHPQIVMWFCAHYHLGHTHPEAMSCLFGTTFFNVGVHGNVTRDGKRQSRIIDTNGSEVSVNTLDHGLRSVSKTADWYLPTGLARIITDKVNLQTGCRRSSESVKICTSDINSFDLPDTKLRCEKKLPVSGSSINPGGIVHIDNKRCLVATANGYLWNLNLAHEVNLGTFHMGTELSGAVIARDGLWKSWGNEIARCNLLNEDCYIRYESDKLKLATVKIPEPVVSIARREDKGIYACSRSRLYEVNFINKGDGSGRYDVSLVKTFSEDLSKLAGTGSDLHIIAKSGNLYSLKRKTLVTTFPGEKVIDIDTLGNCTARLSRKDRKVFIVYKDKAEFASDIMDVNIKESTRADDARVMFLSDRYLLIWLAGDVYILDMVLHRLSRINLNAKASSVTSVILNKCQAIIYLGFYPKNEHEYSQIQIWKMDNPLQSGCAKPHDKRS